MERRVTSCCTYIRTVEETFTQDCRIGTPYFVSGALWVVLQAALRDCVVVVMGEFWLKYEPETTGSSLRPRWWAAQPKAWWETTKTGVLKWSVSRLT